MEFVDDDRCGEQARLFAEKEVAPSVAARDRERRWEPELFRRMGAAGLLGATLPGACGGGELSSLALAGLMRGFAEGSGDPGLALAWVAHTVGCAVPVATLGTGEQRRRYLQALVRGDAVGALAHEEQLPAAEPIGVRTTAARTSPGRWVLHGTKSWVVNGPVAQLFVVTAVTDPVPGKRGVSAFLVHRDTPGLTVGRRIVTTGLRTAAISELVLDGCELSDDELLGAEGEGLTGVGRLVQRRLRVFQFAPWLGFMRVLVDRCVVHARERLVHGRPLSHSQTARAVLADMRIRLELSRRMLARAAWQLDAEGEHAGRDVATCALFLAESVGFVARGAVHLHGAQALESHALAGRLARDADAAGLLVDGPDVLRAVIAGSLLDLG
ncbi:acyl-CoA dehydrogenase family protein [Nannocystis pusilla]|uniref:acyl-CoA dehydrogenase family protein n=1 Tax=Nannocystis pusilla TaxID=889268 RepID=UPI001CCDB93B